MILRRSIIGVMGSGIKDDHFPWVKPLGALIAEMGFHILTGGGFGVMKDASDGFTSFKDKEGLAIGILPVKEVMKDDRFDEYPNEFIEINIQTHLLRDSEPESPLNRNHINTLTANALVFFPGNHGTFCELELAKKYKTPSIFYLGGKTINELSQTELKNYGFPFAKSIEDIREFLETQFPKHKPLT
jgi:uncharacterized protein (TIGR00725 family)